MLKGFSMRKENAPPSPCHLQREECSRQSRCGADRVPAGIRCHSRRNQKGEACDYVFHIVLCNKHKIGFDGHVAEILTMRG